MENNIVDLIILSEMQENIKKLGFNKCWYAIENISPAKTRLRFRKYLILAKNKGGINGNITSKEI